VAVAITESKATVLPGGKRERGRGRRRREEGACLSLDENDQLPTWLHYNIYAANILNHKVAFY